MRLCPRGINEFSHIANLISLIVSIIRSSNEESKIQNKTQCNTPMLILNKGKTSLSIPVREVIVNLENKAEIYATIIYLCLCNTYKTRYETADQLPQNVSNNSYPDNLFHREEPTTALDECH